jgi:cytidylate kinase
MSIVAISETAGSLGNEIGRRLAESLGWGFADREIIAKAAERFGADIAELRHGAEEKPSLWERFTDSHRRFKTFVEASVLDMAVQDRVVLAGLASTLVLRDIRHALRVRTTAPSSTRAARLQHEQGLTPEASLDVVRQTDRERAARVKFLYDVDVDDPLLYDVVLNTERVSTEEGVRYLREMLRSDRFQASASSKGDLADLNIVAQTRAMFAAEPAFAGLPLFVSATGGQVLVTGTVGTDEVRTMVERRVAALPGVKAVLDEVGVVPTARSLRRGL